MKRAAKAFAIRCAINKTKMVLSGLVSIYCHLLLRGMANMLEMLSPQ